MNECQKTFRELFNSKKKSKKHSKACIALQKIFKTFSVSLYWKIAFKSHPLAQLYRRNYVYVTFRSETLSYVSVVHSVLTLN